MKNFLLLFFSIYQFTILANPNSEDKQVTNIKEKSHLQPISPADSVKVGVLSDSLAYKINEIESFEQELSMYLQTKMTPDNIYKCDGLIAKPKGYGIQVGSYVNPEFALNQCKELKDNFSKVFIEVETIGEEKVYRVMVGEYASQIPITIMGEISSKLIGSFSKKYIK
ncbi:MAG: SPOR domain-containing protein [Leptospiraceae bacterium]|nr:SPOR domain-containing protein [Leptospiraceae bacterium]